MVDSYQVLLIVYQRDVTNVRQSCGYRETVLETPWTAEMSYKADVAEEDFGGSSKYVNDNVCAALLFHFYY